MCKIGSFDLFSCHIKIFVKTIFKRLLALFRNTRARIIYTSVVFCYIRMPGFLYRSPYRILHDQIKMAHQENWGSNRKISFHRYFSIFWYYCIPSFNILLCCCFVWREYAYYVEATFYLSLFFCTSTQL